MCNLFQNKTIRRIVEFIVILQILSSGNIIFKSYSFWKAMLLIGTIGISIMVIVLLQGGKKTCFSLSKTTVKVVLYGMLLSGIIVLFLHTKHNGRFISSLILIIVYILVCYGINNSNKHIFSLRFLNLLKSLIIVVFVISYVFQYYFFVLSILEDESLKLFLNKQIFEFIIINIILIVFDLLQFVILPIKFINWIKVSDQ